MRKHGIVGSTAAVSKFSRFLCQPTVPMAECESFSYPIGFPALVTFVSNFVHFGGMVLHLYFPDD